MGDQDNQDKISALMRADWNRRVNHDYRFWMSAEHFSDEQLWKTGARDLEILTEGIADQDKKSFLEVGCGVGRLLRPALEKFRAVIGVDVSDQAIAKAHELLGTHQKLTLEAGNGIDLKSIATGSVQVVASFASLTSMPTEVIAGYLREMHRVLAPDGVVRLQMYLGTPRRLSEENTITPRCFTRTDCVASLEASGFRVQWIKELKLPFEVSSKEWGLEAVIISLEKSGQAPAESLEIARLMLPQGEPADEKSARDGGITVADFEYWMTLNCAKDLCDRGDFVRARSALEYALTQCQGSTIDATKLIAELEQRLGGSAAIAAPTLPKQASVSQDSGLFERNFAVFEKRFPTEARPLRGMPQSWPGVEVRETPDGPVVFEDGQCLDHATKPKSAGEGWAKRLVGEKRIAACSQIIVFGFGAGYHIEELLKLTDKSIAVIEPRAEVFAAAMRNRDLTHILSKVSVVTLGQQPKLDWMSDDCELVVRPQTQVVAGQLCATVRAGAYGKRGITALHPKIAVLGPLQGGTLPMAAYVTKALGEMKQRVTPLDVSGFAPGYHEVEKFAGEKVRRTTAQNRYLAMVSALLLDNYDEKPFDILLCMAQAPISGETLTELRKRGVITVLWFVEDYLRFSYWREMAKHYDFVFTIQRGECIEAIRAAGAGEVHYLPTACDPELHYPFALSPEDKEHWGSPVSFFGAGYHNRQQVFASLTNLPFKIWGTEWPTCKPFDKMVQESGRRLLPGEYIKIFNGTDVNLNLHSSSERDGVDPFGDFVNPRTFELAACGAFQLVDERQLLPECFEAGSEIATFKSPADMREKIQYYLDRPEERRAIAERGRARVIREHTYVHRMRSMFSTIYASKFEQLKRRESESPWSRLLARAEKHPELSDRCKRAFERGEEPNLDGLISDIVTGNGKLSETEQMLLFMYHIRKQTIRMKQDKEGKE